ncbi:MAG: hypothetical protein ACOYEV_16395 [Candidatus Nanopelagicales bacterium]
MSQSDPSQSGEDPARVAPDGRSGPPVGRNPLTRRTRSGRPLWLAVLAAVAVGAMVLGLYQRQSGQPQEQENPADPAGLVMPEQAADTRLTAVGRTSGLSEPCTAWLVAPGAGTAPADSRAYAVTAGRCVGIGDSATVISGQALAGASVDFNAFASLVSTQPTPFVTAKITDVVWASLRFTDLAVLRLDRTYGDLAVSGVLPIRARKLPDSGQVLSAGVPVTGIPAEQRFVRAALCDVGDQVSVLEGPWLLQPAVATNCIGIRGGSAGSPLLTEAGEAVGQITTTTLGAATLSDDCPVGQPCAVTDSVSARADTSYAVPVAALDKCFHEGEFRLGGQCKLEDPETVVPVTAAHRAAKPGSQISLKLDEVATQSRKAANKVGDLPRTKCHSAEDWGAPVALHQWRFALELPEQAGWTLACVGSAKQPTPVVLRGDGTPPDAAKIELTTSEVAGGLRVAPVPEPPEIATVWWTSGPKGTDCTTAEGFTQYLGTPQVIPADDLPAVVCLIAVDEAGNRSQPVGHQLD